jgi:hypothetical protein
VEVAAAAVAAVAEVARMAAVAEVARMAAVAEVARMAAVDLSRTAGTKFFFNQKPRSIFRTGFLF